MILIVMGRNEAIPNRKVADHALTVMHSSAIASFLAMMIKYMDIITT
jgi:hypothetical protein